MAAAAQRSSLLSALAFILIGATSVGLAGLIMLLVSGGEHTWSYWAAYGVVLYALATAFYGSLAAIGLFR
jgi:predicted membrane channel-forming protein YqfA (hemolysin III family)